MIFLDWKVSQLDFFVNIFDLEILMCVVFLNLNTFRARASGLFVSALQLCILNSGISLLRLEV